MSKAFKCDACGKLFEATGYSAHVYVENVCVVLVLGQKKGSTRDAEDADLCPSCLYKAAKQLSENLATTPAQS